MATRSHAPPPPPAQAELRRKLERADEEREGRGEASAVALRAKLEGAEPEQTGAAGPAEEAMLMCMECEEEEADETANMSLECAECEEEVIDDSSAVPETARMTGHDAKKIPGNGVCFECDAALSSWEDLWISTSFGTLLCAGCAQQHRSHGAQPSIQRLPLTARLPAHVCALVARGGNAKMRKFLAGESIGVSPAIWRELPLELLELALRVRALGGKPPRARRVRLLQLLDLPRVPLRRLVGGGELGAHAPCGLFIERLRRRRLLQVALVRLALLLPRNLEGAGGAVTLGAQALAPAERGGSA